MVKLKTLSLCIVGTACISTTAIAQGYYTSQSSSQSQDSGYSSSVSTGTSSSTTYTSTAVEPPHPPVPPHKSHKKHDKFSISVTLPGQDEAIVFSDSGSSSKKHRKIGWVKMRTGFPLPANAVVSGGQPNPPATLYVCRAGYNGGLHPGKLFQGHCNISWGGREIVTDRYEVLVSTRNLPWVSANNGAIPSGAMEGGYENHRALYICQAEYNGGRHSGKVVGQNCNFGWGGREISVPYYNVLMTR